MSESRYQGKYPVTSVRVEILGTHAHLTIWVNHGCSGTIVVRANELTDMLPLLAYPLKIQEGATS